MKKILVLSAVMLMFLTACSSSANDENIPDIPEGLAENMVVDFTIMSGSPSGEETGFSAKYIDSQIVVTIHGHDVEPYTHETLAEEEDFFEDLTDIVETYDMKSWLADYQPEVEISDGSSFEINITFADGSEFSSSGYSAYPENYGEAHDEVEELFDPYKVAFEESFSLSRIMRQVEYYFNQLFG